MLLQRRRSKSGETTVNKRKYVNSNELEILERNSPV